MGFEPLLNENKVLTRISGGDRAAFTLLFKHYQKFVFSFSKRIVCSDDAAGEVVQEIFIKLWLNREKLSQLDNFGAYLNRLVRNHSLNVIRQELQAAKTVSRMGVLFTELDNSTLRELDFNETKDILNQAISELSPRQRLVYELCHQQGLKYIEVAERMNISTQTVNSYMKEALKKIRLHFRRHALFYPLLILCMFD